MPLRYRDGFQPRSLPMSSQMERDRPGKPAPRRAPSWGLVLLLNQQNVRHQEGCSPCPTAPPSRWWLLRIVRSGPVLSRVRKPLRKLFLLGRWGRSPAQSWLAPVSPPQRQRYEQGELETSPSSWRGALDLLMVSA